MKRKHIITDEKILEINKLAFRNSGAKIAHILNNLSQLEMEKKNGTKIINKK